MGQLITVEELPRYAPGELKLDSTPVGRNDFRLRIFRYAAIRTSGSRRRRTISS